MGNNPNVFQLENDWANYDISIPQIVLTNKEEWPDDTGNNLNGTQGNYPKWKSLSEKTIYYDLILYTLNKILEKTEWLLGIRG